MKGQIDFNKLARIILEQAREKGWGHTKETLLVPEKMMLITTEITELQEARDQIASLPKDTMDAEYADILTRTLHLGIAWGVDFNKKVVFKSEIESGVGKFEIRDLLYLHNLVARGYESWRHKKIRAFKKYLYKIVHEVTKLSQTEGVDIEKGAMTKLEINRSRVWSKKELNGSYH